MIISNQDISVVVPAFNRAIELKELLVSILQQTQLPSEVLICEDYSPERELIKDVCNRFIDAFSELCVELRYIENATNMGYDGNLRTCIETSSKSWAVILGNDDVLLPCAIMKVVEFLNNNDVDMVSRCFVRFDDDINTPLGISSINDVDTIFKVNSSSSKMIFRATGFIGGLVVNVAFCKKNSTTDFDGTLYYQIYLASVAFCEKGIGYISTPIVGGRAGNPPMFGTSDDNGVHIPGSYTAKGRAAMWQGVLDIVKTVGSRYDVNLSNDVKKELEIRQSFHIFEMNAGANHMALKELKQELKMLGLFSHPIPNILYTINVLFGKYSHLFYKIVRRIYQ